MEKHELAIANAKKTLQVADHMATVTYKVVGDPKLLLAVVERINDALTYGMSAILSYERMYKRIPPYGEGFEPMFSTFKSRITRRYNINIEYITLIQEVNTILKDHKNSPIEFRKDNRFVICSENYRMKVISVDHIKKYIQKAKLFINEAENMVKTNGRDN